MTSTYFEIIVKGHATGAILTYNGFGTLSSVSRIEGVDLGGWDTFLKHLLPKSLERMKYTECDSVAFRQITDKAELENHLNGI